MSHNSPFSKIHIEEWFLLKNFTEQQLYVISIADQVTIKRETEKACYIEFWNAKFGSIFSWVPKSVCGLAEKSEAAKKVEEQIEARAKTARKRLIAGCERYERVLAFAKEHKVKGARKGLRLQTLLSKIAEAGLTYEEPATEEKAEEKAETVEAVATEETTTETTTETVATIEEQVKKAASGFVPEINQIEALREKIIATATATVNPEGLTPATLRQRVLDEVVEVSKRAKAAFLKNAMNKRLHIFWKAARLAVQTV